MTIGLCEGYPSLPLQKYSRGNGLVFSLLSLALATSKVNPTWVLLDDHLDRHSRRTLHHTNPILQFL